MGSPVTCVLLNFNRPDETVECLRSLCASTYSTIRVIVLNFQSADGSAAAFTAAFPGAQIVELLTNRGYAGNNNVGIQIALEQDAGWVMILNEDTILAPDCVERLVEVGERDSKIGIVGPMVYHHDEPGMIQSAGGDASKWWDFFHLGQNTPDRGQFEEPRDVRWISGCAMLVRREMLQNVGLIDERFFMYFEETEWCIRAASAGWRLVHVPTAKIWHRGVQRHYEPKPTFTYYTTRNHLLLLSLHHAPLLAKLMVWTQFIRRLISWSVRPKWRNRREHRDALWRGMKDFLRHRWGQMPSDN